jgi:two-component system sensor histidine kinase YesM
MQPEKELYDESRNVQLFIYLIIVISVVLAFMISLIVYKGFAAPLSTLLYGMKQIRLGNYDMRLPNKRKDQLGVLTDAFNQMIAEQQRLIRDVYEHQLRLSYTELKFLQSQINPHFLYNTLDSIYWTAKNYDAEEISEMVLNLSKFFRLSLSKGKETFTVAETVEHMRYYLRIQQFRLLGQLDVRFDIAEETKNVLVLKLLLQPIVENAILHGLEKQGGGVLRISSRMDDKYLYLTVADSGPGIATDRLAYIRRELAEFERLARFSPVEIHQMKDLFGLRNVLGRMKLYYGPEAALEIDSRPKAGTTVTLRIPSARAEVSWEEKSA